MDLPCAMNKVTDGTRVTACFQVDDLFITSLSREAVEDVIQALQAKYGEVSCQIGQRLSYLGMTLDFDKPGQVNLTMNGYISNVLAGYCKKTTNETQKWRRRDSIRLSPSYCI